MTTIVASVEGFLRRETTQDLLSEGVDMLGSLQGGNSVTVLLTTESGFGRGILEELLDQWGVGYDLLLEASVMRVQQLRKISFDYGYAIDVVIEPDPAICAELVANGYLALGFFHPRYARREWRPDHQFTHRPWDDLVAEVIKGKGESH